MVLARGTEITPEDLLLEDQPPATAPAGSQDGTLQDCLDRAAEARIRAALAASGHNRNAAAQALGIERTTLYRMMKRLGIDG